MSDQVPMDVQSSLPGNEHEPHASIQPPNAQQQLSPFQIEANLQQQQQQQQQQPTSAESGENSHNHSQPSLEMLQQEATRLSEINAQLDYLQKASGPGESGTVSDNVQRSDADARSVYVGNVDYGTTPLELQQHFSSSGVVERVTIMSNKLTGQPKGFAYLEFAHADSAKKAVETLNGSMFRERELKVSLKRTNVPGLSMTSSSRGGFRGRGRGRGMMMRGRGRGGFRGRGWMRGAPRFSPY